ncbi:MAG: gamma-glutamyltransferase [Thermoplasmataceae archaeon]
MSDERFAVASGHPLSNEVGMRILRHGGNSYDAAIAVSAALTVVQPHLNGLGADLFAITADGEIRALDGSGNAAGLASIDYFNKNGFREIPKNGPLSAISVPGMVGAWSLLYERCNMRFQDLIKPAIELARNGFFPSPAIVEAIGSTKGNDDWSRIYNGASIEEKLIQKDLAGTLEEISKDEGHSFYHGQIARAIETAMVNSGGLLRFNDMDSYEALFLKPFQVSYHGYKVYTNPPPSQGSTALMWLNMLNHADLSALDKKEYYNELIRTMRIAYSYRSKYIGDPRYVTFPEDILESGYQYRILPVSGVRNTSLSDTTAFSVYDGNFGISAIQSNYTGFGSGFTIPGMGINLNNRGSYFTLDSEHNNKLEPGKKTFHTLMAMYAKGRDEVFLGTMGGDVQPQVDVQVLSGIIDLDRAAQDAVAYPRFAWPASIYGGSDLYCEASLDLEGAIKVKDSSRMMGHAHAIISGDRFSTGLDPRGDGLLLNFRR